MRLASSAAEDRMAHRSSTDRGHIARHVTAGLIGGLVGAWVMELAQRGMEQAKGDGSAPGGGGQQHRTPESEPATYQAADAVTETVAGHDVPESYKPAAGALVHYAFGGAVGAIYGAAAARTPDVTAWGGVPFGAAVWLIADEMGVPLAGLSKAPTEYPLADHASALAAHFVYGATADCVRRMVLRIL